MVGTLVLVGLGLAITSAQEALVSLLIAAMVGAFGVVQVVGYKRVCTKTSTQQISNCSGSAVAHIARLVGPYQL